MSGPAGALHVAVRLPGRTAEPAGQLPRGVGCRHTRVQQVRGGVDPLGEHVTTSATSRPTTRHVTNILLDMSHRRTDTPRQFDTPIAQRHLKAEVANCVGGVSSPLLANLFLHYGFDLWISRKYPGVRFERFADDAVIHCVTERQAWEVRESIGRRFADIGLSLHPEKTKIVYCKDSRRHRDHPVMSFTFCGYAFRPRKAFNKAEGRAFTRFLPAVDPGKLTDMSRKVASWKIHRRITLTLNDLARGVNPALRGWLNYFTVFYPSMVIPLCWRVDRHLMHWARRKYKRLERGDRRARAWLCGVRERVPRLFAHWELRYTTW